MPTSMVQPRRKRRHSRLRRSVRKRWADYVVIVVFVVACIIALLLLVDVIDTTVNKQDKVGVQTP